MISNERPSPYGHHGQRHGQGHGHNNHRSHDSGARGSSQEDTLQSTKIQIERKTFVLTLKENARGRFLRITEDVNGRRDTIIIPSTGLEEFRKAVEEMVQVSDETPPRNDGME